MLYKKKIEEWKFSLEIVQFHYLNCYLISDDFQGQSKLILQLNDYFYAVKLYLWVVLKDCWLILSETHPFCLIKRNQNNYQFYKLDQLCKSESRYFVNFAQLINVLNWIYSWKRHRSDIGVNRFYWQIQKDCENRIILNFELKCAPFKTFKKWR